MQRFPFASAHRTRNYEHDIAIAFHQLVSVEPAFRSSFHLLNRIDCNACTVCRQIRGVKSVPGCSSRAVYIWRTPNVVDESNSVWDSSSHGSTYAQCIREAMNATLYPSLAHMTIVDIAELKQICREIRFDGVGLY